jgi:hypothetical protein
LYPPLKTILQALTERRPAGRPVILKLSQLEAVVTNSKEIHQIDRLSVDTKSGRLIRSIQHNPDDVRFL